jgi:carboxypeptidase family protein
MEMKSSCASVARRSISSYARSIGYLALLCALFGILATNAWAQEATIVGTVTDPTGAAIPNVNITITSAETGQARKVPTNAEGQYIAPNLHIGNYTVRAEASGFKTAERKDLKLQVGDRARIDFQMTLGTAQETVTVEALPVAVQTDSGEVSQVVTGQQVSQLASNGRSFYSFVNATPGASSIQGNFSLPVPVGGDANVSFNGQRMAHNIYLLDGGENLDRGGAGTFSVMPSVDAIAEFRTMTSNYSADYGLSSSATISSALKSGTNSFHASAWEFLRNDALDANDYFRNRAGQPKPELRFNLFGFNVGGPVDFWKSDHKTFFFYNMEWRRIVQGGLTNQKVPPTSAYPGGANGDAVLTQSASVPNLPASVLFRNCPGGTAPAGITPGAAFPNNTIPGCMIEPNAVSLLNAGIFPANNSVDASGNPTFVGGSNVPSNVREEIVRIDHNFNNKINVFGHFIDESILQTFSTTMWSGDNVPTVGNTFGNPSYSAVVHLVHTISPTLLNEIAFNYNGNRINILPLGTPALTAPSDFTFNRIFTGPNDLDRIPTINLSNQTGTQYSSNWTPWVNKADDYQIRDDLSWTKGTHQFKMGFSWALYKKIQDIFATTQGNFRFDGSFSGYDYADYLLGLSQQYQENAVKDNGHWNNISYAAYFQDNWRATKRLTLNLGLRWDGVPHTYEANHRTSNFYPNLYDPAQAATFDSAGNICSSAADPGCTAASPGLGTSPNPILSGLQFYLNGIGFDGVGPTPKGLVDNHWAAFGPRLGFAYDLTGSGKTVVRGGFGMMYERIQGNDMYNAGPNVPFSAAITANNVLLADPHTTTTGGATPPAPIVVSDIVGIARDNYQLPVSYQYSIGVQQQVGANTVLSASYVGNQNRHQNYWSQTNLPDPSQLASLTTSGLGTAGESYNQLVPFLGFHEIRLANNGANAHYNSLQLSWRGRVKRDLDFQFGYTLSRAEDPTTGNGGNGFDLNNVSNPYVGWRYDLGPSPFDRKHVAFVNFVYDIPFLRSSPNRALKTALGGWQISGVVSMQSGAPIDITDTNHSVTSVVPNTRNRPDLVGTVTTPHTVDQWFGTLDSSGNVCTGAAAAGCAFVDPAPGTWGNTPHAFLRGPGRQNWNLSVFKNFNFTERARLEFRAESFNTWNHTQFMGDIQNGGISTGLGASDFGQITRAYDPRQIQFGLKLIF